MQTEKILGLDVANVANEDVPLRSKRESAKNSPAVSPDGRVFGTATSQNKLRRQTSVGLVGASKQQQRMKTTATAGGYLYNHQQNRDPLTSAAAVPKTPVRNAQPFSGVGKAASGC
jgi:hypothetical protein